MKELPVRRRLIVVPLLVIVLSLIGGIAANAASKLHVYRGKTSQGLKIQFGLVRNQHGTLFMQEVGMGITMTCEDASVQHWGLGIFTFPGERLHGHALTYDSVDPMFGIHVTGTFKKDAAFGTLRTNLAALDANEQAQLCTTGDLTWTAHRSLQALEPFAGYRTQGRIHVHELADGAVARYARRD
jgi:hypothetical protein